MLLQLFQYSLNAFYVFFTFAFSMNVDVIKVHYHKNVELIYQNLIDVALERDRCICQFKRHHLVLEIAIVGPKDCFLFIAFSDLDSMISIGQIELGETLSPT